MTVRLVGILGSVHGDEDTCPGDGWVEVGAAIHVAAVLPFVGMLCGQFNTGEATRFTIDIAQISDGSIHALRHVPLPGYHLRGSSLSASGRREGSLD